MSTGGVRKNGKMESQFKNPVPYEEPKHSPTPVVKKADIVHPCYTMKDRIKNEAKGLVVDIGWDLAYMSWCDFGKPFLEAKLNQAVDWILSSPQKSSQAEDLTPPVYDSSDKIIQFPKKHVG